jgi:hypothetical protein
MTAPQTPGISAAHSLGAAEVAATPASRVLEIFTLPDGLPVTTVGLVERTVQEELMASRRAGNDAARLVYELAKESLRMVDGVPVSTGDGSVDAFFARRDLGMSKVRQLILQAVEVIHNPAGSEVRDFLASRQSRI